MQKEQRIYKSEIINYFLSGKGIQISPNKIYYLSHDDKFKYSGFTDEELKAVTYLKVYLVEDKYHSAVEYIITFPKEEYIRVSDIKVHEMQWCEYHHD